MINAAIGLLGWLRTHDRSLADATQADIDLFLASGPPSRRAARDFLRWAGRHRLCAKLDIVRRRDAVPVPSADLAELARIARRLLTDDDVALVDRVAGLLVICYGQPASRIIELTVDRVGQHGDAATLRLGRTDIELPDTIATLILRLVNDRHGYAAIRRPDAGWLFPGALPGRPLTAKQLQARLGRLGINLRAARTTVLIDFAGELAPTVIADTLGLSAGAAVRWVKAASGDWNAYAVARRGPAELTATVISKLNPSPIDDSPPPEPGSPTTKTNEPVAPSRGGGPAGDEPRPSAATAAAAGAPPTAPPWSE